MKTKSTEEWVDWLSQNAEHVATEHEKTTGVDIRLEMRIDFRNALTQHTNDKLREVLDGIVHSIKRGDFASAADGNWTNAHILGYKTAQQDIVNALTNKCEDTIKQHIKDVIE